jgi:ubiquinone/menaquinone biosynthesis C-methylase UbiE
MLLSERQQREKEFYDQYADRFNIHQKIDFSPIVSRQRRPWNSYWTVYEIATQLFKPQQRMLDFGSGPGENALRFAKIGYYVEGFDISETNIALSKEFAAKNGMANKVQFQVSAAEKLPFTNDCFDFIAGIDILHHVDIKLAVNECKRVLKPGGIAVFREPLEVPLLDKIRNTKLILMIAPKGKSFENHITHDERKLNQADIDTIQSFFPNTTIKKYSLFSRFDKFFREGSNPRPSLLEQLDHVLFAFFPFLKRLGGVVILVLKKD